MSAQQQDKAVAQTNNSALAQLQAQLRQLRTQFATLQTMNATLATQLNMLQNAGPAAPAAAQAAAAPATAQAIAVAFALTPATSNLTGLINFLSKVGMMIYNEGCKKLTDDEGFPMTLAAMSAFFKVFTN